MESKTDILADGKSPLTHYVKLLVSVPRNLEKLLDRDAEAIRILTATPALHEAIQRAERWYWDRQREKQTGKIVPTRRIWTRRDERRVNILEGRATGLWPSCRAARYIDFIQPQSGVSLHDNLFRLAVNEAKQDGSAAAVCPKLEQAQIIYERLISAARSSAQDNGGRKDFDSAKLELGSIARALINWTKPPMSSNATSNQNDNEDEPIKLTSLVSKSNEKLRWLAQALFLVQEHPDWSDAEIARQVGKHKSTLSRDEIYQAAAALARGNKNDVRRGHVSIDPESGRLDIEAYTEDPPQYDLDD